MIYFMDGIFVDNPKKCLHCRYFIASGCSGGGCLRKDKTEYVGSNNHCKYFKRNFRVFYSDGRIKNEEYYNEMFM